MIPERTPRRSRSERKFIRREKARDRQDIAKINQHIEINVNKHLLAAVGKLLSPEDLTLSALPHPQQEQTRASLEIKQIWLKLKCGVINQEQNKQLLSEKFDKLQGAMPDVYYWLVHTNLDGPSRAQKIRDEIFPPIRIAKR